MTTKRQKMSFNCTLDITVPFETEKQATIAKRTLEQDPILKPNDLAVRYKVNEFSLDIHFEAISDRVLRVAVSSTLESLKTVIEVIDEFE